MYSDLFEHLGGGRGGVSSSGAQQPPAAPADAPIVQLKAGKLTMVPNVDRGTYTCTADPSRGEIRLACVNNVLEWQWYDRRQKKVVDRRVVEAPPPKKGDEEEDDDAAMAVDDGDGTLAPRRCWRLERVTTLPPRTHKDDRVYVLTHNSGPPADVYDMYWMQDADESKEEEAVEEFNKLLADPVEAVARHGGSAGGDAAGAAGAGSGAASAARSGAGAAAGSSTSNSQVDALSSILENLGMPQSSSSDSASPAAAGTAVGTNTLTLADLQGAMAGIQQQQQRQESAASAAAMSLTDVVTPDAVTALLQDEAVCARLVDLLPEGQRNRESLEDNLRSPQVQQTLRSLTSALLPDDAGRVDGFLSVIANFQLGSAANDPGTVQAASTNPIQAFLDAVDRSVQEQGGGDSTNEGEGKDEEESKQE
jgi:26S proteasome regulatory subunit N13